MLNFDEHNWYLLYSPWLRMSRSLRVSKSTMLTLEPFWNHLSLKNKNMSRINFWWTQVVLAELPMVELDKVAEGVREPIDHPVSHWDSFKSICLWKIAYKHASCQYLMNITGWACRGRWGCPIALRSSCDSSRSFSFQRSCFKCSNVHFYEYRWYLLYSPWLSLSRSPRVS